MLENSWRIKETIETTGDISENKSRKIVEEINATKIDKPLATSGTWKYTQQSLIIKEMQIKITMRYNLILVRTVIIKRIENNVLMKI